MRSSTRSRSWRRRSRRRTAGAEIRRRLVLVAGVLAAAVAWVGYDRIYGRGGDRPVAWNDRTAALDAPAFVQPATRALDSRGELEGFLAAAVRGRPPAVPMLDFGRRRALLVTTGPRSSAGYALDVVSIREERRRLVVHLRERTPRLGDRARPRLTYPFRLLTVPRSDKPVHFTWEGR
jgi:hypothetical protein